MFTQCQHRFLCRLPIFIRPVSYDLELSPNLTTLAVKGIIKLIFQVTEETHFIVFHIKDINITSKTINEKLKVSRLLELREREQMYLETNQPMRPGKMFSVRLKFEYNLTRGLEGFYISSYKVSAYFFPQRLYKTTLITPIEMLICKLCENCET